MTEVLLSNKSYFCLTKVTLLPDMGCCGRVVFYVSINTAMIELGHSDSNKLEHEHILKDVL